jgi:predicted dehydrogenase
MESEMKIGMVGLDTSHCVAFTKILNDQDNAYHIPGAEIVAAFAGGSQQFSHSRDRVQGFTEQLKGNYGIALYDSIPALVQDVDAILLESVDGRQHLEQFVQMAVGKPVYIDKPFTTSLDDALAIAKLAQETDTPIMSCSSLRYAAGITELAGKNETVVSCEAFGPAAILEDYPGLFWYGIHSAEMLFAFMGTGCASVQCIHHADVDVVIGEWRDGRTGILKGTRFDKGAFGCVVHTDQGTKCGVAQSTPPYYYTLLQNVISFFKTRISPIDIRETLEIVAFLEAADTSKARNGKAVAIETTTEE